MRRGEHDGSSSSSSGGDGGGTHSAIEAAAATVEAGDAQGGAAHEGSDEARQPLITTSGAAVAADIDLEAQITGISSCRICAMSGKRVWKKH